MSTLFVSTGGSCCNASPSSSSTEASTSAVITRKRRSSSSSSSAVPVRTIFTVDTASSLRQGPARQSQPQSHSLVSSTPILPARPFPRRNSESRNMRTRQRPQRQRESQWPAVASIMTIVLCYAYYYWESETEKIHAEIFLRTAGVILAVTLVAVVLICAQDLIDQKLKARMTTIQTSEPVRTTTLPSLSSTMATLATHTTKSASVAAPASSAATSKVSEQKDTHISSSNMNALVPIVEGKEEDGMFDYWWYELDSKTKYFALILGYTEITWDQDKQLEDLSCEDLDWDELTEEQKEAARYFGYDQDTWDEEEEECAQIEKQGNAKLFDCHKEHQRC